MNEDEYYRLQDSIDKHIAEGVIIAKSHNINFTKFKAEIIKGLVTVNDSEQWIFDYQSYLESLPNCKIFYTPTEWAEEFYYERWNNLKN